MGATPAFFQCQSKQALERAIAHKARVEEKSYSPGALVYAHREYKGKKRWMGPCTVIGREGQNYWLARGGRRLLCAPEHIRTAHHEEVNEGLRIKMAMRELHQLLKEDEGDSFDEVEGEPPQDEEARPSVGPMEMEVEPAIDPVEERARAIQAAARKANVLDDVPVCIKRPKVNRTFMVKKAISARGQEKQLDKELPWQLIPPDERELYREAEEKQWKEHIDFQAVRPLSVEESNYVRETVPAERILNSRFLYRDKNRAKRRTNKDLGPKAKARLCVAGQWDPDLGRLEMSTDAPTVSGHSIILALQVALARGWKVSVGDIRAAFLNGIPAPRNLYFRQPKRGIPSLEPGQLVEVLKGVFGLSTSPKLWWMKLSKDLASLEIQCEEEELRFEQNPIDPCVFMLKNKNEVKGLLLTHVDDIMLMCPENMLTKVQEAIKQKFPIDEWENDEFEYVGCEYKCKPNVIEIHQEIYASSRVDKVSVGEGQNNEDVASPEQKEENRTTIGCLSWLAKQTRPDLQCSVCQCQRRQQDPKVEDLKNTNKAVDMCNKHKHQGLKLHKIEPEDMCMITYHDAAWGNVDPDDQGDRDENWIGEHNVASQLANLVMIADKKCMTNEGGKFSVIDWKSKASQRVCRSTFAGETMACCEGLENSIFLRSLILSMMTGERMVEAAAGEHMDLHLITDCRSLYDHVHREGVPRAPSEKRLAIDLAGLRQGLMVEGHHQWKKKTLVGEPSPQNPVKPPLHWLPTQHQLADVLTKKMRPDEWWKVLESGWLSLPLKGMQSA